ncbi:MAG: hypothetical protein ACI8ZB_001810 [Desulforhopalus sp.]|jgi:hypothetical protein
MTPARSEVFARTYQEYLCQIRQIDFLAKADILGLEKQDDSLLIPVYNTLYRFDHNGIETTDSKELSPALQVIVCKYILTCPLELKASNSQLQPYREFKDAAPLVTHFTTNTSHLLETVFAGKLPALKERCLEIGGKVQETEVYDLSFLFYAFPRIPVIVNFNDKDELFSAACSILYNSSAANYLDMECLSMTGTLLSGILTHPTVL